MDLIEDFDYLHTGWRPGEPAWLDAPPRVIRLNRPEVDREFATQHAHLQAVGKLRNSLMVAYEAALTDEQKAERSRQAEAQMMAEAREFYANRAPGDNRSFWD
jgi:hypothetical protein